MLSPIPGISQLVARCILRQYPRSLGYGHTKAYRPLPLLGLMVLLLASWKTLPAQLIPVNGPIALPATNVASSSAAQNILLKTTSAETINGFTDIPARTRTFQALNRQLKPIIPQRRGYGDSVIGWPVVSRDDGGRRSGHRTLSRLEWPNEVYQCTNVRRSGSGCDGPAPFAVS